MPLPPALRLRPSTVALLLIGIAYPAQTCGPFFAEAIFVRLSNPGVPYPTYVAGHLGVLQPGYAIPNLVIAYNILSGRPLSPAEQKQAITLQTKVSTRDIGEPPITPGLAHWIALRQPISLPGSGIGLPFPNATTPPTINVERAVPGESYQTFTNCLDDSFETAAKTLQARRQAHGASSPEVLDWVHAQDAVFSNCAGPRPQYFGAAPSPVPADLAPDRTPDPAPASASPWLKQDRAYQVAAAHFYRTAYTAAAGEFRAIAADTGSPWHQTAQYLVPRTLLRHATVGQDSDLPAAPPDRPLPYDVGQKYQATLQQQMPTRFREARTLLEAIRDNPQLTTWHQPASSLIDLIDARIEPGRQATVLAGRLTAVTPPANSSLPQNLLDLNFVLHNPTPAGASSAPAQPVAPPDPDGLLAWIAALRSVPQSDDNDSGMPPSRPVAPPASAAAALGSWQRTHSLAWLVAALTLAQPGSLGIPGLLDAAQKFPSSSPAYLSATYQRLRLSPASDATRREIAALLPTLEHTSDPSAVNLFRRLQSASSPTLEAFLAQAARIPAAVNIDGEEADNPFGDHVVQPCGPPLTDGTTPLFADDSATILNQRMPLRLLAQAALSTALPANLRFQVAQSAWTRALLLNQPAIARSLAPVLIACHDSWRPVLDAYAAAQTPEDLHVATLFALMRFASTEPLVRNGEQRPDGFATYSQYRDNWWCGNQPTLGPDGKPLPPGDPRQRNLLFNQLVVPASAVPDPPFLSPADKAEAATEIAELKHIPGAPDYFARQSLDFFHQHPDDARTLELLGQAERVVRNGCRSDATKDLNHQLFDAVQLHYPNSEWAKRYPTWE